MAFWLPIGCQLRLTRLYRLPADLQVFWGCLYLIEGALSGERQHRSPCVLADAFGVGVPLEL
jgi:hypothetical protein